MNILYSHLNINDFSFSKELKESRYTFTELPEYALDSIKQSNKFGKTHVVTINDLKEEENKINEFYNLCKNNFPSYYKDSFWLLTLLRLYTLHLYVEKNNIEEFLHIEYDNLIYKDPKLLRKLPDGIYFTKVGPELASAGIVYCSKKQYLSKFIQRITSLIKKGERIVKQFTQQGFLSEMVLIDLIKTYTNDIDYLPTLPGDKYFEQLQCVFDGASYGQYLGGTNNGHPPGWYGLHHNVGIALHNKKIEIIFDKSPFVLYNNVNVNIFNLHLHCKQLKEFM